MNQRDLPGKHYIVAHLLVQAPAKKVWDVLADFSAVDTWAPQVTKSYAFGAMDRGIGAERHCDIKGFGSIDEMVTEWDEGHSLTYKVTPLGPLDVSYNRWTVHDIDESSSEVVVEFGYGLRFGLMGKLLHKVMMRRKLDDAIPRSLEALKKRVETGQLVRPRRSQPDSPQLISASA